MFAKLLGAPFVRIVLCGMLLASTPSQSQQWTLKEDVLAGTLEEVFASQFRDFFTKCGIRWPLERACSKRFWTGTCELASIPPALQSPSLPLSESALAADQFSTDALGFVFDAPKFSNWVANKGEVSRYFASVDKKSLWVISSDSPVIEGGCLSTLSFAYGKKLIDDGAAARSLNAAPLRFEAILRTFRPNFAYVLGNHDHPPPEQLGLLFELWRKYDQKHIKEGQFYIGQLRGIQISMNSSARESNSSGGIWPSVQVGSNELILIGSPTFSPLPTWQEVAQRLARFEPQRSDPNTTQHLAAGLPLEIQYAINGMPEEYCTSRRKPWRIEKPPGGAKFVDAQFADGVCRFSIQYALQANVDPNIPLAYRFHLSQGSESGGPDLRFPINERLQPTKEPLLTFDRAEGGGDRTSASGTPARALWRMSALVSHKDVPIDTTVKPRADCVIICNNRQIPSVSCEALWDAGVYRIEASHSLQSTESLSFDSPASCSFSASLYLKTVRGGIAVRDITSPFPFDAPNIVPAASTSGRIIVQPGN